MTGLTVSEGWCTQYAGFNWGGVNRKKFEGPLNHQPYIKLDTCAPEANIGVQIEDLPRIGRNLEILLRVNNRISFFRDSGENVRVKFFLRTSFYGNNAIFGEYLNP